ncbi:right-handed parallel beta-helix repeat-containing protein [candidate division KSB1 bacterium]|nr:right-handed parallel beta-helix repeat-containing protein [candidate division KSB1 bacterium]
MKRIRHNHLAAATFSLIAILFCSAAQLAAGNAIVQPNERISAKLANLQPGDTLFVRAGTYSESLSFPRNGTAQQPIVLMAYPGERPLITSSETLFELDESYWIIDGFIFDHENADSDAILIRSNASNNIIRNCEIRNGKRDGFDIKAGATDNAIANNIIHNFFKSGADAHGIVTNPGVIGLSVLNNEIFDNSGDCIQLYSDNSHPVSSYSKNVTISGNRLYTTLGSDSENALDFKGVDGCLVANNDIFGFDDKAVVVQKGCRNIVVEGNIIRDSQRGIEFRGEDGKSQENMTVRRNLIYNISDYFAVKFDWVDNVQFINNTIAFVQATGLLIEEEGVTNSVFKNNLFFQCDSPSISGTFDAVYSNNGWFGTGAGDLAGPNDLNGAQPNVVDAGNYQFQLNASSPAIDAGVDVGLNYQGTAPDLGAFEYSSSPTGVSDANDIKAGIPSAFRLDQNWPNPFDLSIHKETTFNLQLEREAVIEMRIYNVLGQTMQVLFRGALARGQHAIAWDGQRQLGGLAAPGIYFIEVKAGNARAVRPFVLVQ